MPPTPRTFSTRYFPARISPSATPACASRPFGMSRRYELMSPALPSQILGHLAQRDANRGTMLTVDLLRRTNVALVVLAGVACTKIIGLPDLPELGSGAVSGRSGQSGGTGQSGGRGQTGGTSSSGGRSANGGTVSSGGSVATG